MTRNRTVSLRVVVVALLAAVTACGTTLPQRTIAPGNGVGPGLGGPSLSQPSAASVSGGDPAQPGSGPVQSGGGQAQPGALSASPGPAGTTGALGSPPPGPLPQPGTSGRGYTATKILIGFGTQQDASAFGNSVGLAVAFGDQKADAQAVIDDLNAHGGLLGRKIVPDFYDISATQSNTNPSVAAEAACTHWTQDAKVFAVINPVAAVNNTDTFFACMHSHNTPVVFSDAIPHPASLFAKYPQTVYAPAVMSLDRLDPVLVDRLSAQGYFGGWDNAAGAAAPATPVKVGLLIGGDATGKQDGALLTRLLTQAGHPPVKTYTNSTDLSQAGSDAGAAVLQFRSSGVTHVVGAGLFFFQAAQNQQYRPRYSITTFISPAVQASAVSKTQLTGSMGVGFLPDIDVDSAHDPGDVSPGQGRCRQVMRRAGQDTSNRSTFYLMQQDCESFALLQQALSASKTLSTAGLAQGVDGLGTGFTSAITFRSRFGPGRHDSAAAVRDLRYDSGCSCFTYGSTSTAA